MPDNTDPSEQSFATDAWGKTGWGKDSTDSPAQQGAAPAETVVPRGWGKTPWGKSPIDSSGQQGATAGETAARGWGRTAWGKAAHVVSQQARYGLKFTVQVQSPGVPRV